MAEKKSARYMVRIANTDLQGIKQIGVALTRVKGISRSLSHALCNVAGISERKLAGDLSEAEERQLNQMLQNPAKAGIPEWMLNRRRDYESGEDIHLIGADVGFVSDNDIKRHRKLKTYKGQRHVLGLPVRGQRTQSNFRKNKTRGSSRRKAR